MLLYRGKYRQLLEKQRLSGDSLDRDAHPLWTSLNLRKTACL